jgi:hypothetical protein
VNGESKDHSVAEPQPKQNLTQRRKGAKVREDRKMLRRAPSALTRVSMINGGRSGIDSEYLKKECILVTRILNGLRGGQNPVLPYLCAFAALREFILLPSLSPSKTGQDEILFKFEG